MRAELDATCVRFLGRRGRDGPSQKRFAQDLILVLLSAGVQAGLEFFGGKGVGLGAVALHGKGGDNASQACALDEIKPACQAAQESATISVPSAGGVDNLSWFAGGDGRFALFCYDPGAGFAQGDDDSIG
jgi:hypothetical protein